MRLDDYLSTVGVIKRRTVAKDLAAGKMINANGRRIKPSYQVTPGDIIEIKGNSGKVLEVLEIPSGSVSKESREKYFKLIQ